MSRTGLRLRPSNAKSKDATLFSTAEIQEVGASRGTISIWIGNHRDIAIF
jgi:hypothetical protein